MENYLSLFNLFVWGSLFLTLVVQLARSIRMVPTKSAYIVERLGKYNRTLAPGFHALIPFIERVTYIQNLKEKTLDVPPQECFTSDNVQVQVDGVMYISVIDPQKASYGVVDYQLAASELAQTTIRSVLGTLDLDKTFEERGAMSSRVVEVLSEAGQTWGVAVHRYEVKNIVPPASVKNAMEKQVSAEREKRAVIAESEGEMQSRINRSEGQKMEMINQSQGEKQRHINEAEGQASEILAIARATANSIEQVGAALVASDGSKALYLQQAQRYLENFGQIAASKTEVLIPADLTNLQDVMASLPKYEN